MKKVSYRGYYAPAVLLFCLLLTLGCQKAHEPVATAEEIAGAPFKDPKQLKDFQQVNLVGKFATGKIEHNLLAGVDADQTFGYQLSFITQLKQQ